MIIDLEELKRTTPRVEHRTTRGRVVQRYTHCVVCGDPLVHTNKAGRPPVVCPDEICKAAYNKYWHRTQRARRS